MKENDKWVRRQIGSRYRAIVLLSVFLMVAYKVWDILSLGRGGASHREEQWEHSTKTFGKGKRIDGLRKSPPTWGSFQEQEEAILEARVHLVDLRIPVGALSPNLNGYSGVRASFCEVDWSLQKKNPSTVAMFRELVAKSYGCQGKRRIEMDLGKIIKKARAFDAKSKGVSALEPKGFVFHETRCGSTLVANLLASFDPPANRIYSESPPPVTAMKACEGKSTSSCDPSKAAKVLQDVIYLMGRTNDIRETNVFYKIQSVGVRSISVFREAFPTTPWLFVYRDSVEVFMSHYKNRFSGGAVCLRALRDPPDVLKTLVKQRGRTMDSLSKEEFCAAHLASLCESAIQEHELSQTGRFVNYAQLPDVLWNSVVPEYFGVAVGDREIERMEKTAEVYSKGHASNANRIWSEDSTTKQDAAPKVVKEACQVFLTNAHEKMEAFSQEGESE